MTQERQKLQLNSSVRHELTKQHLSLFLRPNIHFERRIGLNAGQKLRLFCQNVLH
jgi:hypothetical protein